MFEQTLDLLSEEVKNSMTDNNDYIGENGLLYCGKCRTPRQCAVNFLGKEQIRYCLCECEQEKDRQLRALLRRDEISRNRRNAFPDEDISGSDERLESWTFDRDSGENPKITNAAKKYVENFPKYFKEGKGLLFYGDCGRGKSVMAACIANALLDRGCSVLFTTFSRISNEIQNNFGGKQDYLDSLNHYSLLILDDFGAERDTSYMRELVSTVIDSRRRSGRPLILTSNITDGYLKNPPQEERRIVSRVIAMCTPIPFTGVNLRRNKAVRDFAEMRRELGL